MDDKINYWNLSNIKDLGDLVSNKKPKGHIEDCLIEEMSELTKAIIKGRRGKLDMNNLIEELGHVMLMCSAMISCDKISINDVIFEANDAVARMLSNE